MREGSRGRSAAGARAELASLAAALAIACGAPSPPPEDAGTDATAADPLGDAGALPPLDLAAPAMPAPAATPAAPVLGPCALGSTEQDGGCIPDLDAAPDCAAGEHRFATGCRRAGSPCTSDGWPATVPADRPLIYASLDGRFDGAGTREDPVASLATAVDRLGGYGTVVLGPGVHRQVTLTLRGDVEVLGACPEQTRIESILAARDRILVELFGRAALRDVTVASRGVPIVVAEAGTDARLTGVVIEGGHGTGVLVTRSAVATIDDVVIREIVALDLWGEAASGVLVDRAGEVHASRLLIESLEGVGVGVGALGRFDGRDVTVREVRARAVSPVASCVNASGGAVVGLADSLLERCPSGGVIAEGADTRVRLEGLLVRETLGDANGADGAGAWARNGATLSIRRSAIAESRLAGILAPNATLDLEDVRISDTLAERLHGWGGQGVFVGDGATATLARVLVERPRSAGVEAHWGTDARLIASDLTVRSPRRAPVTPAGAGVTCGGGTTCEPARVLVEDAEGVGIDLSGTSMGQDLVVRGVGIVPRGGAGTGIHVGGTGTATLERVEVERASSEAIKIWGGGRAVISDAWLRDTLPDRFLVLGNGIWVTEGAHLELTRALLEDLRFAGIYVDGSHPDDPMRASELIATDLTIRRIAGDDLIAFFGNGIRTASGTQTTLRRVRIEDAREAALVAFGVGTTIDGEDVEILRTRMRACTERDVDRCATDIAGGCGLTAFDEGAVTLRRFRSADNALCGVMVAPRSTITLADGEIARNPIGANVQTPGYDLALLSDEVRYVDNDRNYDGASIPVPDDAPPRF